MDLLTDVLQALRVESTVITRWDLSAPWGVDVEGFRHAYYVAVIEGQCCVWWPGHEAVVLRSGDCLLVPHGADTIIASSPGAPLQHVRQIWTQYGLQYFAPGSRIAAPMRFTHGGGGETTRILTLAFSFLQPRHAPLLTALPEQIVLPGSELREVNRVALALLTAEESTASPGYFAVACHLAELLFISLLRQYALSRPKAGLGWLNGLSDARIARALGVMHAHPSDRWTVGKLASVACLSRSTFALLFARLLGETPIQYLQGLRMQLAADMVGRTRRRLSDIAVELGYQSDRAFRAAFVQRHGASPRKYRRTAGQHSSDLG